MSSRVSIFLNEGIESIDHKVRYLQLDKSIVEMIESINISVDLLGITKCKSLLYVQNDDTSDSHLHLSFYGFHTMLEAPTFRWKLDGNRKSSIELIVELGEDLSPKYPYYVFRSRTKEMYEIVDESRLLEELEITLHNL